MHGQHLRLRVFMCHELVLPDSPLHHLLSAQSHIEELIGVDFVLTNIPILGADFLPSLRVLMCDRPITAETILPGRSLEVLQIEEHLQLNDLASLADAVDRCPGSLREIRIDIRAPFYDAEPSDVDMVRHFIGCFPRTEHLGFGPSWHNMGKPIPSTLPSVMSVEYETDSSFKPTAGYVAEIAAQIGPSVRLVTMFAMTSYYEQWRLVPSNRFVLFAIPLR